MKDFQKMLKKIKIWSSIGLILILVSCDLSTHKYYLYSNNQDADNEIYFLWPDSSRCGMTIKNSSIDYDTLTLYFPSDKSSINNHCELYYDYIRDSLDVIIDSTEMCADYFAITENDQRVIDNDHVILYIYKRNSLVMQDTLFREKVERSFIDRLPLPRHL